MTQHKLTKTIAALALAGALTVVPAASADSGDNVVLRGTVVGTGPDFIAIAVEGTNAHGETVQGQIVNVTVASNRIVVDDTNGDGFRSLADVLPGDQIVVHADASDGLSSRQIVDLGQ
jgi:hypothetical protein